MKTKEKDTILMVAIVFFFMWMIAISIAIVDLYAITESLLDLGLALKDSVSDLQNYIIDSFKGVWL